MEQNSVIHYCVKCLAPNYVGHELCVRCGTRLMLMVEPAAARYEDNGLAGTHVEHLLERVSALESRLARLTDRLQLDPEASVGSEPSVESEQSRPEEKNSSFEALLLVLRDEGLISMKQIDDVRRADGAQKRAAKD
jgi:hypothetical protein